MSFAYKGQERGDTIGAGEKDTAFPNSRENIHAAGSACRGSFCGSTAGVGQQAEGGYLCCGGRANRFIVDIFEISAYDITRDFNTTILSPNVSVQYQAAGADDPLLTEVRIRKGQIVALPRLTGTEDIDSARIRLRHGEVAKHTLSGCVPCTVICRNDCKERRDADVVCCAGAHRHGRKH